MPNIVTRMVVREYEEYLGESTSLLLVSIHGLTVAQNDDLRDRLAEKGVPLRMVRNRLLHRALAERGIELDASILEGNTGLVWGDAEAVVGAAKVFTEKEIKRLEVKIKGAVLDGQPLSPQEAVHLADIPDKDTLRSQLLGVLAGPARGLVTVIDAVPSSLARVLQAHVDAEGAAEES